MWVEVDVADMDVVPFVDMDADACMGVAAAFVEPDRDAQGMPWEGEAVKWAGHWGMCPDRVGIAAAVVSSARAV